MEDDDAQSVKITDATITSPITGDSPALFPNHKESAEDVDTTASDFTPATGESLKGTRHYPL